jgi:hypothetical protein
MAHYVCHVRLKGGEYETGADFYQGDMRKEGEVIQIVVCGQTLKGCVGVVTAPQTKTRGVEVIHICVMKFNDLYAASAAKIPVAFRLGDAARQGARQCRMVSGESRPGRELEECRALEAARSAPDDDDRHGRAWRAAAHHRGGDQSSIRPQGGCRWQL